MAQDLKPSKMASGQPEAGLSLELPDESGEIVDGTDKPLSASELFAEIQSSGLIGMWKGRKDIDDSSAFARTLRQRAEERPR